MRIKVVSAVSPILAAVFVGILLFDFLVVPASVLQGSSACVRASTHGVIDTSVFYKRGVMRSELYEEFSKSWWVHHEVEPVYDTLKNYGVEVVRVMLNKKDWFSNPAIFDIEGNKRNYRTVIDDVVFWCANRGMYVILEHGVSTWGETPEQMAQGIYLDPYNWFINWMTDEIATRYANNPHVILGLVNEPANRDAGIYTDIPSRMARWREVCIKAIDRYRAVKPNGYIIVQSVAFQTYNQWHDRLLPYPNIIYGIHDFYHHDLGSIIGKTYPPHPYAQAYWEGRLTEAKSILDKFLYERAFKLMEEGVPVFVDEFGAWVPDNNWDIWLRDFYDICRKYRVGWTQLWWHGYWRENQGTPENPEIDYHLLKDDWETLSPIGEVWAEEMK